jgi:putative transposase
MLLAHKIELRPTPAQAIYLDKSCGSRRHCYNQLLEHFGKKENKWSKSSAYQYYIKTLRPQFDWYTDVSSRVTRNAIDDLDNAFKHFFRRIKAKKKAGFPRFKCKDVKDSFALREKAKFNVKGRLLRIEKLKTKIKMRQTLRFEGQMKQVTISKRAGKYFASILVETQQYNPKDINRQPSVGVDFGIKELAVLSNSVVFGANQKLKARLKKLKKIQKNVSRKQKKSNHRVRAKLKVAKLHFRIANQRQAVLHQLSDYLTRHFDRIVIEDLNIKGMVKNHKLARSISDAGFGYLRQQIEYKGKLRNCEIVIANRFFPSSKTCSACGSIKKDLSLRDRIYHCDCGLEIDRDLNAAINLKHYGEDTLQPTEKRTKEIC